MKDWLVKVCEYKTSDITTNGNRFLCGNGYLGIRGTLEEYGCEHLPAINLAGIYDKVGDGWREPVNAPNPLYTRINIDGVEWILPEQTPIDHKQQIDYRHGLMERRTTFQTGQGMVTISSERFVHMGKKHIIGMRYSVMTDYSAKIELVTGIDGKVWDINGPHFDEMLTCIEEPLIMVEATTHEKREKVVVAERCTVNIDCEQSYQKNETGIFRKISFHAIANQPVVMEKVSAVYTSQEDENPSHKVKEELRDSVLSYNALKKEQINEWEKLWETGEVEIEGDPEAQEAINYSLYHLLSIAPFHAKSQSIPARGLSGQTYKGAIFWDTEMFMLDFFINCYPEVAKTLLRYRIDSLAGAKEKASHYGYGGAFYAWESQEGGFDACSDYNVTDVFTGRPMRTYFKDKQIHISAAIVYGIHKYVTNTGDRSLLYEGGAKTILECAIFYDSLLVQKAHTQVYELRDVIGPDEYHERVDNNGYTNRAAKFTFEQGYSLLDTCEKDEQMATLLAEYLKEGWKERLMEDTEKLYLQKPGNDGIVEQFDGYRKLEDTTVEAVKNRLLHEKEYWGGAYGVAAETQIIKQADVVTWMVLFPEDFTLEQKWVNWSYYEPRTEHGSSLSACMYSILACVCGKPDIAYPFFLKSAQADIKGGGKEWAGEIYIGGTHPAAAGGAYMTAIYGFGGMQILDGKIAAQPRLPKKWEKLKFRMYYQNQLFEITETKEGARITELS